MGLGVCDRRRGDEALGCGLPERRIASAQAADDVVDRGAELSLVRIHQAHRVPAPERDLCDAATHGSGTDDADVWALFDHWFRVVPDATIATLRPHDLSLTIIYHTVIGFVL